MSLNPVPETGLNSDQLVQALWKLVQQASASATNAFAPNLAPVAERAVAALQPPPDPKPLLDLLDDFRTALRGKGTGDAHADAVVHKCRRVLALTGWRLPADVTADGLVDCLHTLRTTGQGRHGHVGLSIQTCNHYLAAFREFVHWLVRRRHLPADPTVELHKRNADVDQRHPRRAITPQEFQRLLDAAAVGPIIETLPGADRVMLYLTAAWTGFRKRELGSLTPASFRFDDDPPTVTVRARYSKHRKEDVQILHPAVADHLHAWVAMRALPPDALLWPVSGKVPGGVERKTHKMMQLDLKAAGIPYRDAAGHFADFHSQRHTFATNLAKAGVHPTLAQELMRHSDPKLTQKIYTHLRDDAAAAIAKLPLPVLRPTGTADVAPAGPRAHRPRFRVLHPDRKEE